MERCGCGVARHSSHTSVARLTGWLTTSPTPEVWKRNLGVWWGGEQWCSIVIVWCGVVLSSQNWFPVCPPGPRAGRNTRVGVTVSRARTVAPPPPGLSHSRSHGKGLRAVTDFLIVIQSRAAATGGAWAVTSDSKGVCAGRHELIVMVNWYPDSWR